MRKQWQHISNPLTLIAIFAGLAEVSGTVALPAVDVAIQEILVWFVVLFPVLLVVLFFLTLNLNNKVLYAPSDYQDEHHFISTIKGTYASESDTATILHRFWKPDGNINNENERVLRDWMSKEGLRNIPFAFFLRSSTYEETRLKAVYELSLQTTGADRTLGTTSAVEEDDKDGLDQQGK